MGGEQTDTRSLSNNTSGSSPRGRGTGSRLCAADADHRFIPAWAGNSVPVRPGRQGVPVHPRVGGEQCAEKSGEQSANGSSPRGRGTVALLPEVAPVDRFIPAWAGNSTSGSSRPTPRPVHPRVGGEQARIIPRIFQDLGSSPRGRGTGQVRHDLIVPDRFIPAWAGNRMSCLRKRSAQSVHPRVGGEQMHGVGHLLYCGGSSPRGRGTAEIARSGAGRTRFIPAWAGNRHATPLQTISRAVHPRVGGEQFRAVRFTCRYFGSSPRGRGTEKRWEPLAPLYRFIPAWAGNSISGQRFPMLLLVHPRVGGEQANKNHCRIRQSRFIPAWAGNRFSDSACSPSCSVHPRVGGEQEIPSWSSQSVTGSSPRGRGTDSATARARHRVRFIPAWAGNRKFRPGRPNPSPVHPRVGGEQIQRQRVLAIVFGSSPRGRGTGNSVLVVPIRHRFIPAWAGNSHVHHSYWSLLTVHPRVGGEQDVLLEEAIRPIGSSPRGRGTV